MGDNVSIGSKHGAVVKHGQVGQRSRIAIIIVIIIMIYFVINEQNTMIREKLEINYKACAHV
jgi:hypothetical protein